MGSSSSRLKDNPDLFQRLKETTYFSGKELDQWHKRFLKDFPNGTINREEFESIYTQLFPKGDSHRLSQYLFNAFDQNKDGLVEFEEYIVALSMTSRGTLEEKLQWTFQLYDLDSDGLVSRDELLTILKSVYDMTNGSVPLDDDENTPEKRLEKIMLYMDLKDGKGVTQEEFIAGCKSDPSVVRALSLYDGLV